MNMWQVALVANTQEGQVMQLGRLLDDADEARERCDVVDQTIGIVKPADSEDEDWYPAVILIRDGQAEGEIYAP